MLVRRDPVFSMVRAKGPAAQVRRIIISIARHEVAANACPMMAHPGVGDGRPKCGEMRQGRPANRRAGSDGSMGGHGADLQALAAALGDGGEFRDAIEADQVVDGVAVFQPVDQVGAAGEIRASARVQARWASAMLAGRWAVKGAMCRRERSAVSTYSNPPAVKGAPYQRRTKNSAIATAAYSPMPMAQSRTMAANTSAVSAAEDANMMM